MTDPPESSPKNALLRWLEEQPDNVTLAEVLEAALAMARDGRERRSPPTDGDAPPSAAPTA